VSQRIKPDTFDRMCAERGKTPSEAALEMGMSSSTLAKIHRGERVGQSTIDKAGEYFGRIPVLPLLAELIA